MQPCNVTLNISQMKKQNSFAKIGVILTKDQLKAIRGGEEYDDERTAPDSGHGCQNASACLVYVPDEGTYSGICWQSNTGVCGGRCLCAYTPAGCYTPKGGTSHCW